MSRADQGLIAAICFVLLVLFGFGGSSAWIAKVQSDCTIKQDAKPSSPLSSKDHPYSTG